MEEVPGTAFVVSRVAGRDNLSSYYVDGKKTDMKKVTEMLKGKGIDLDNNRFLILQGEVEQISMMKPKAQDKSDTGLLEYLEDIIGTIGYVEKIEEMTQDLDKVTEERQSALQHVKAAETQVSSLEGAKAEAEAYLGKERELKYWKCAEAQMCHRQADETAAALAARGEEVAAKMAEEEERNKEAIEASKVAEAQFKKVKKEHDAIEKELEVANDEFRKFEAR